MTRRHLHTSIHPSIHGFQAYKTVELVRAKGGKVSREAGPVKGGTTVIAFVELRDSSYRSLPHLCRAFLPEPSRLPVENTAAVPGAYDVGVRVQDPDGYKFEILQRAPTPEPFCQVMLRVGDLPKSIAFYETVRLPPPTSIPNTREPRVREVHLKSGV